VVQIICPYLHLPSVSRLTSPWPIRKWCRQM
jgi:hypothetical protein